MLPVSIVIRYKVDIGQRSPDDQEIKMSVYTHNTRDTHEPCTFVKQIVTDAALEDLNLSDDWFEIDPQEVADVEELTGMDYAEADGYAHLSTETTASGHTVRKYGRL
jgi:hypothetical protein